MSHVKRYCTESLVPVKHMIQLKEHIKTYDILCSNYRKIWSVTILATTF